MSKRPMGCGLGPPKRRRLDQGICRYSRKRPTTQRARDNTLRKVPRLDNVPVRRVNFMYPQDLRRLIDAPIQRQVSSLVKNPYFREYLNSPRLNLTSVLTMTKLFDNVLFCEHEPLRKKARKEVIPQIIGNVGYLQAVRYHLLSVPAKGDSPERIGSDLYNFLSHLCRLFDLIISPGVNVEACNILPVDTLWGTTRQLAKQEIGYQALHKQAKDILEARDKIRQTCYKTTKRNCGPEFNINGIVLPTRDELSSGTLPLSLQKNIVKGAYVNEQQYLDIQYTLLREDFIHPLRCAYHNIECTEVEEEELYLVYNSEIKLLHSESSEVQVFFQLPKKLSSVCWERTKRLSYGNLLCFINSTDVNNVIILFATVAERNVTDLENGFLTVAVLSNIDIMRIPSKTYSMIESPGFYAAYSPVLQHLHSLKESPESLPFSKYIVKLEQNIDIPSYMLKSECNIIILKLHNVLYNKEHDLGETCPCQSVNIMDKEVWDNLETPELNESQKKALYCALTNELAIIQGPPGTGKTYTGLKIVQTLLENRTLWDASRKATIVLVCYTNHALDQFLEGIMKQCIKYVPTKIRRIGGRSKSEMLKEYNIRNFVLKHLRSQNIFGFWRGSNAKLKKIIIAIKEMQRSEFSSHKVKEYVLLLTTEFRTMIENLNFMFLFGSNLIEFASWLGLVPKKEQAVENIIDNDSDRKMEDEEEKIMEVYGEEQIHKFFEHLSTVEPLTDSRAREMALCQPGEIEPRVRLQLFKYFVINAIGVMEERLKHGREGEKEYEVQKKLAMIQCLKEADVVGMTTTLAARHNDLLSEIDAKVIIVEEAAEILEAHIVSSLSRKTEHLILIGDHKQLRPKTNDHKLASEYNLDISLFQRLIENGLPHVTLECQHRMRPEISELVSAHVYNNSLKNSDSVMEYPSIDGLKHNVFFIDHNEPEGTNIDLKSKVNSHEAKFLARLCNYILQQGVYLQGQITVLTPYTGQMFLLRDEFKINMPNVKVTTIDSYQGEENDIILLSLVRSERPGFVADESRICVALSRAKHGLFVIGCFSKLFVSKCKLWRSIITKLRQHGRFGTSLELECQSHKTLTLVANHYDFDNKVLHGGCNLPCNSRLPCNHVCPRKCHPNAKSVHKEIKCVEQCPKFCEREHRCNKKCSQCNGQCICYELVEKIAPKCGHQQQIPCYLDPSKHTCQEPCTKFLLCGHKCDNKCGEAHTIECKQLVPKVCAKLHNGKAECYLTNEKYSRRCKALCQEMLMCGHLCHGTCGECRQGRLHKPCTEKCDRDLNCGHKCSSPCSLNCPPCKKKCPVICPHGPCDHPCEELCRPCPHSCTRECQHQKCTRLCGEVCNVPPCDKPCLKKLLCNHPCMGLCGETCPDVCGICDKDKFNEKVPEIFCIGTENIHDNPEMRVIMLDCGHMFEVSALDKYYRTEADNKIQWVQCMMCRKPVMNVNRYKYLHLAAVKRINQIKKKEFSRTESERSEMLTKLCHYLETTKININNPRKILKNISDKLLEFEYIVFHAEYSVKDILSESHTLEVHSEETEIYIQELQLLRDQRNDFVHKLERFRQRNRTNQVLYDIQAEQHRLQMLSFVIAIHLKIIYYKIEVTVDEKNIIDELFHRYKTGPCMLKMSNTEYESSVSYLKGLENKYPGLKGVTKEEKEMVIKVLNAKPGSWYYCPNGHVYNIGECGGAMVESQCPECKARIGGFSHRLRSDNRHAGDFDGSAHSAWPGNDNMGDYVIVDEIDNN